MVLKGKEIERALFARLREWCDGLIEHQLDMPAYPEFDGGILCSSCKMIHGRCSDAVYPMLFLADRTGEEKYLNAARKLFKWAANMIQDNGSLYCDAQAAWNGITVFNAIALYDALSKHGHLLTADERKEWEDRMLREGEWLYARLKPGMKTNINYFCTNAAAMALLGKYFGREDFLKQAKALAEHCLKNFSQNDLLFGEGTPNDGITEKGCRAIDVAGYNVEESLPSILRYAEETGDEAVYEAVVKSLRAHLDFLLPDGAWDNSVGTRNFKWTYWGSRTSDGCQEAFFLLGKRDPVFAEAAWRNFELYERCSGNQKLMHGGPDYEAHGELPCVHHNFCHAKALAGALDNGLYDFERCTVPAETEKGVHYYEELDTCILREGDWQADITAYDFFYMKGGHASGGAMSLLWNKTAGAVIASGSVDYSLHEAHNQQQTLKVKEEKSPCPRIELKRDGVRYSTSYDYTAKMTHGEADGTAWVKADTNLVTDTRAAFAGDGACRLEYALTADGMTVSAYVPAELAGEAEYILPIVSGKVALNIECGALAGEPEAMFNLNPGFMGKEYRVKFDACGKAVVSLRLA